MLLRKKRGTPSKGGKRVAVRSRSVVSPMKAAKRDACGKGKSEKVVSPRPRKKNQPSVASQLDAMEDLMRSVVVPSVDLLTKKRPTVTGLVSVSKMCDISVDLVSREGGLKVEDSTRHQELMAVVASALVSSLLITELFRDIATDSIVQDNPKHTVKEMCSHLAALIPAGQLHLLDEALLLTATLWNKSPDFPAFRYGCEFSHDFLQRWELYCEEYVIPY